MHYTAATSFNVMPESDNRPAFVNLSCAIIAFMFTASILGAQGQPAPAVKAITFPVTDVSPTAAQAVSSDASPTEGSDHSQSLFLTISAEFREAGFEIIPEDQWRARKEGANLSGHDFLDPSKAAAAARAVGADLAVGGSFSVFSIPH